MNQYILLKSLSESFTTLIKREWAGWSHFVFYLSCNSLIQDIHTEESKGDGGPAKKTALGENPQ